MPFATLIPSFNAGELSPYMAARSEVEKYFSGCKELENFIVMTYGGAFRRPGTEYLGAAKFADKQTRLIGFNYSISTSFMLELGEGYIRFWKDGLPILDPVPATPGAPLELSAPYGAEDLRSLQYKQINDIMEIVSPDFPPHKLSRLADDNWTFDQMEPDWPAMLDENITSLSLTSSVTSGTGTLTASASAWITATAYKKNDFVESGGIIYQATSDFTSGAAFADDGDKWKLYEFFSTSSVGSYFQMAHDRNGVTLSRAISSNGSSTGIAVLGSWEFTTYGTWNATVSLQRSYDNGTTWEDIRTYKSAGDRNTSTTGTEAREAQLRITVTGYVSNTDGRAGLELRDSREYGFVKITDFESPTVVDIEVRNALYATTATTFWSEGAWSNKQGFPRALVLHQDRMYYAATAKKPLSIWGSNIDDFENFRLSSNDDAGLFFSLSAEEANPIQWLVSQQVLLIGTSGEEWSLGSPDATSAITPSNVQVMRRSSFGSKYLRAIVANNVILFVQRMGRKLRELVYDYQTTNYKSPDLTVLSEHVTQGEIVECAFQQQPDAIYWAITGKGKLVGMTYERDQDVVGWHRHSTKGTFESVATIHGVNGGPDEVWFTIKRTINGQDVRYIERFKVDFRDAFENENKGAWWYLDCAARKTTQALSKLRLDAPFADLNFHRLPAHETVGVNFTNTTGVDVIIRYSGLTQVVPAGNAISIPVTNTNQVEYKYKYFGNLVFGGIGVTYDDPNFATGAFNASIPFDGDNIFSGKATISGIVPAPGWLMSHARLDIATNKIDMLAFALVGIVGWAYNDSGPVWQHTENEYPEAGEQTLSIDRTNFFDSNDLIYDEVNHYDLSYYPPPEGPGPDNVRLSQGTISYNVAEGIEFEYLVDNGANFNALSHLEGEQVQIFADGAVQPDRTVSNGAIVLQDPAENVLVGLKYISTLTHMPLQMVVQSGSTKGSKKKIFRACVSFLKSLGGEYRGNMQTGYWNDIFSRAMDDAMNDSPPVFTGDKEFPVGGNYSRDAIISLRQEQPLPLTVLAITPIWEPTSN